MTDGCLGTEEDTFIGGHGLVDDISDLPTLDEKEIIRKCGEQIIEKMKVLLDLVNTNQRLSVMQAMDIVKEEGGIE